MFKGIGAAALACTLFASAWIPAAEAKIDQALVKKLKPTVVNISVSVAIGLHKGESGSWVGTGFIADAKRGLIVTNKHVSGQSPAHFAPCGPAQTYGVGKTNSNKASHNSGARVLANR